MMNKKFTQEKKSCDSRKIFFIDEIISSLLLEKNEGI